MLVQLLDLSRNQLNGFTEAQANILQKINNVQLENNPLICDECHMGYLLDVETTVSITFCIFYLFLFYYFMVVLGCSVSIKSITICAKKNKK